MKKKLVMLTAAFVLAVMSVAAQKAVLTFQEKEFDFGQIKQQDGKVTHVFELTNTGNAPLIIQNVQPTCGCTSPDWTKEPIAPGKKGTVSATYNPTSVGPFHKGIVVRSNASNEQETIYIKGTVLTVSQESNNSLSVQMGALRANTKALQMNNVNKGKTETRSISIKNSSNANLKVDVSNLPSYITAVVTPNTLKPEEDGKIDVTFNSANASIWGPVNDNIYVVLNGKKTLTEEYKIAVNANITEDLNTMGAAERRSAPILEVKSSNIFFGNITKGHVVSGQIALKNIGVNNLEIRRVVNNNGEITIHPTTMSIRNGKTTHLKTTINTKTLAQGEYRRVITVQTNDPQNQFVIFNLTWNVK